MKERGKRSKEGKEFRKGRENRGERIARVVTEELKIRYRKEEKRNIKGKSILLV